jgi:hypothetical protein
MTRKTGLLIVILFVLAAAHAIPAQQQPAAKEDILRRLGSQSPTQTTDSSQPAVYYRLDLVIREMDGEKLVDTRNYSLWVQAGVLEMITTGSEVPYPSNSFSPTGSGTARGYNYRSVGVQISCIVKEGADSPQLDLKLEVSNALPPEKDSDMPAFRKFSLNSRALLALGKPTTVSIVEDPASKHRFQVDVTATKLK